MDKVERKRREAEKWARWVVDELRRDDRALKLVTEVVELLAERARPPKIV